MKQVEINTFYDILITIFTTKYKHGHPINLLFSLFDLKCEICVIWSRVSNRTFFSNLNVAAYSGNFAFIMRKFKNIFFEEMQKIQYFITCYDMRIKYELQYLIIYRVIY